MNTPPAFFGSQIKFDRPGMPSSDASNVRKRAGAASARVGIFEDLCREAAIIVWVRRRKRGVHEEGVGGPESGSDGVVHRYHSTYT